MVSERFGASTANIFVPFSGDNIFVSLSHAIQAVGFNPFYRTRSLTRLPTQRTCNFNINQAVDRLARSRAAVVCISQNASSVTNEFAETCLTRREVAKEKLSLELCKAQVFLTFRQRLLKPSTCLLPAPSGPRKYGYYHGR